MFTAFISPIYSYNSHKSRYEKSSHRSKSDKFQHEKSIRSELHMLLEKKDPKTLTLAEVKRVRHLMHEFRKFDRRGADRLTDRYIHPEDQCCFELSAFEGRELELELNQLFDNPQPKDSSWNHKVKKFLDIYDHAAYKNGCGNGVDADGYELDIVPLYKNYLQRYREVTGHEYKK
jgi:hypothetical protein